MNHDTNTRGMPAPDSAASGAAPAVAAYRPGRSLYFASPETALLADGPRAALAGRTPAQEAAEALRLARELGVADPVVVGAVPFDTRRPAALWVAAGVRRGPRGGAAEPRRPAAGRARLEATPAPERYLEAVWRALHRIRRGELQKIVLARALEVTLPEAPDLQAVLANLQAADAQAYTYAIDIPPALGGGVLLGASPELLVERRGRRVRLHPLAGSRPRSADPQRDAAMAEALLASDKDRREHALVVEAIAAVLEPLCTRLEVPDRPSLSRTAALWHLGTFIEGELAEPAPSSLELALRLHPTPAVCGTPRAAARALIGELEGMDRGLFAGLVGWCDASGDGQWAVTIRCARAEGRRLQLYAGAGVVAGSDPQQELAETAAKFRTLLDALGVET
ncbi:MAG: isochorismate synthase DhbC [Gammaproteobacteria bacterium]|nr:MAG: isochorismate synthase DhbC [Gammaproteobacteria bacterium]